MIQLQNIQNAIEFFGERENSLDIWKEELLCKLLKLSLGKYRP